MEYVKCDLCGSDDYEVIATRGRFNRLMRTVICRKCGLIYLSPRRTVDEYKKFYEEEYRILYSTSKKPTEEFVENQRKRGNAIYESCRNLLPGKGNILEIGSAAGGGIISF